MSTRTEDRTPNAERSSRPMQDIPAWVRADHACRHAWTHDKQWRRYARQADPPCHHTKDDPYSTGDTLILQARRDYARERAQHAPPAPHHHHAADCVCATCRKRRGEKPALTLKQRQERRKRTVQEDRTDDWRITEDPLVRFASLCEIYDDGKRHDVLAWLRTDFAQHLDALHLFDGLERLLAERPGWACALIACKLLGRTTTCVAAAEGVADTTIARRCVRAQDYLSALYNGREPAAGRQRAEGRGAVMAELDEASRLAQCADVSTYLRRVALAAP